ncbi:hypothetical protein GY45DRAFT_108661 [Cubamyces sp. BRFM 1775]|nr:hypothetical protein GY45DRAFT_108661 [Cubamyces sp. BRFM 1775]
MSATVFCHILLIHHISFVYSGLFLQASIPNLLQGRHVWPIIFGLTEVVDRSFGSTTPFGRRDFDRDVFQ